MSDRLPIVHIGWSRAGSKWLQEVVFPRMRNVESSWPDGLWRDLTWKLSTADDSAYYEQTLAAYVSEYSQRRPGRVLMFSQNEFCGYVFDPANTMWRSADRLKRIFPNAKILVVTRRQDHIVPALHGLYVRTGGHRPLSDVLDGKPIEGWAWYSPYLEYDKLVERYSQLYGRENVKVLPNELARADLPRFLDDLAAFVGADGYDQYETIGARRVNSSFAGGSALLMRKWNRLFVASRFNSKPVLGARSAGLRMHQLLNTRVDPLLRRFPGQGPTSANTRKLAALSARHAASNTRLQDYCDYSLQTLGYSVGDSRPIEMSVEVPEEAERREVSLP